MWKRGKRMVEERQKRGRLEVGEKALKRWTIGRKDAEYRRNGGG